MRKEGKQTILTLVELSFLVLMTMLYKFLWPVLMFMVLTYIPTKIVKK